MKPLAAEGCAHSRYSGDDLEDEKTHGKGSGEPHGIGIPNPVWPAARIKLARPSGRPALEQTRPILASEQIQGILAVFELEGMMFAPVTAAHLDDAADL
jgi:hypothetical protein